jgi:hypothetical protein
MEVINANSVAIRKMGLLANFIQILILRVL